MTKQQMALKLPTCNFCGKQWLPQEEVVASRSFCDGCRSERRVVASQLLNTKPIGWSEGLGPYILPRRKHAT